MKIHILRCGSMSVSPAVPYGNRISLGNTAKQLLSFRDKRVELPVFCYLIEHPRGLLLVDTGWCRELSPAGVYDGKAVSRVLPGYLSAFYRPTLPAGMAIHEQLAERGIRPEDLDIVLLTHFDPDHVAGIRHVKDAKRILVAEDEYFWNCRVVYQMRQPKSLFEGIPMEHYWYRGSDLGTNRWAYDLLGDNTILCVNIPGHTDGLCSVIVQNGELLEHKRKFALLTSDAAFLPKNWEEDIIPGRGFDPTLQRKGVRWIKAQAAMDSCVGVFTSHDPDIPLQPIEIALPNRD
jgi:glyoxylase-like metal-dependent hydrolase (beta-lactamase superfamily II)